MAKRQGDALRELADKYDKTFDELLELAAECGANTNNLSPHNAILKIRKEIEEKKEWEEKAREMGYSSVLIAMKAQGQTKHYLYVPEELQTHPPHWVTPKVKAQLAASNLKRLLPVMDEYCQLGSPEDIEALRSGFYEVSYEQFSKLTYQYLAEMKGRPQDLASQYEEQNADDGEEKLGDLIKEFEFRVREWVHSDEDWEKLLKCQKRVWRKHVDDCSMKDEVDRSQTQHNTATILLVDAFYELSGVELIDVVRFNSEGSQYDDFVALEEPGTEIVMEMREKGIEATAKRYRERLKADLASLHS